MRPVFIAPGVDIAATSLARGGGPHVQSGHGRSNVVTDESKNMVDGDPETVYEWLEVSVASQFLNQGFVQPHLITIDLGGLFLVDRVRLLTVEEYQFPNRFEVSANTSTTVTSGIGSFRSRPGFIEADFWLDGEVVHRLPENVDHAIDVTFAPAMARSLDLLMHRNTPRLVQFSEVQVFGDGYINNASLVGPFIDLEEAAVLGEIRWRGSGGALTEILIRTRAGRDLDPNKYWRSTGRGSEISPFDEEGNLLDAGAYRLLKPGETAGITYDRDNWSFWSAPYNFADSSGTFILSPGPNSVFQVKVDMLLTHTDGGEVEYVEFSVTKPPLAEEVVGEIFPPRVVLGEITHFTYAIAPIIRPQHSGFDRIEISTPFGLAGVDTVKIGRAPVEATTEILNPDSTLFAVQLPRRLGTADSGQLVEVLFSAPVLRFGTPFTGWVRDGERPAELAQRINAGDASDDLVSETLLVRTSVTNRLLHDMQVEPRAFTPNGDGVNEVARFSLNLLQVIGEVPVELEIHDLAGRSIWAWEDVSHGSGRIRFAWDGRDAAGSTVPPGLYIFRVVARTEEGDEQQTGTVAVSY